MSHLKSHLEQFLCLPFENCVFCCFVVLELAQELNLRDLDLG